MTNDAASKSKLCPRTLLEKVTKDLGLYNFGDTRYVSEYFRTIREIEQEVDLSPTGVAILGEQIQRSLTNVLRMQRDLHLHPEIYDEVLAPPIVISGFARTGTTKLQRLLSASPAAQSLQLWKLLNPAPFAHGILDQTDPRISFAQEAAKITQQAFPTMWAAHPTPPLDAEEDFLLHDMTFIAPTNGMGVGATRLMRALTPINIRVYEFLRTSLKYLQWQDAKANRAVRPWVLKSPVHIGNIAAILQVFPNTKFVFCHRDVEVSMASLCSFMELARLMVLNKVDRVALGDEMLEYWAHEWDRNLQQRSSLDPNSFLDLRFDDINSNGMAIAEKVHNFAGLIFDDCARNATLQWEAENPRHQGGKHVYNLTDFGLTSHRVRQAYSAYFEFFKQNGVLDKDAFQQ